MGRHDEQGALPAYAEAEVPGTVRTTFEPVFRKSFLHAVNDEPRIGQLSAYVAFGCTDDPDALEGFPVLVHGPPRDSDFRRSRGLFRGEAMERESPEEHGEEAMRASEGHGPAFHRIPALHSNAGEA